MKKQKKKIKIVGQFILLIIFLAILFYITDFNKTLLFLKNISLTNILTLIIIYMILSIIGIYALILLFSEISNLKTGLKALFAITQAQIIGLITPGNIGELSLIFLFKDIVHQKSKIFATFLIDRIITIFVLGLLLLTFLWYYLNSQTFVIVLLVIGAFFIFILVRLNSYFEKYLKKFILYKKFPVFFQRFKKLYKSNFRRILYNFLLTIIKSSLVGVYIWYGIKTFAPTININLIEVIIIANAIRIINYIGITPGNLGLTEITAVSAFSLIGIEKSLIIITYLLCRLTTISGSVFLYFITMVLKNILIKKYKN